MVLQGALGVVLSSKPQNGQTTKRLDVQTPSLFGGFPRNRYTPVPDLVFDELLATLPDAELRVLLYVIRRTSGFKRDTDDIALDQFVNGITTHDGRSQDHGTGLSRATVARGIKGLVSRGILLAKHNTHPKYGNVATTYEVRFEDTPVVSPTRPPSPLVSPVRPPSSQQRDEALFTPEMRLISLADPQETVPQETDGQEAQQQVQETQDEALAVLWETARVELAMQMSRANYDTWFRDTRLVGLDEHRATIAAPNPFTMEWLQTRCVPLIRKTLIGVLGHPVECSIVVERPRK
jgi:hypothetical protein